MSLSRKSMTSKTRTNATVNGAKEIPPANCRRNSMEHRNKFTILTRAVPPAQLLKQTAPLILQDKLIILVIVKILAGDVLIRNVIPRSSMILDLA